MLRDVSLPLTLTVYYLRIAMNSDKQVFPFPILTTEEAVTNCKSMFGVSMSVDDLLRPQVERDFDAGGS